MPTCREDGADPVGIVRLTRVGIAVRLLGCALVFALVLLPHWVSLRLGGGRWAGRFPVIFHRTALRLFGVRVHESGTPPRSGEPALVLSNHVSWLDILALGSLRPLSFIAKAEIEGWPIIGTFARLQRTIFVDRTRRGATASVNAAVAERLAAGDLVVLFAEGTTGDGLRLLPFRSSLVGAARDALMAGQGGAGRIRLQPLALAYTHRAGLPLTRIERPAVAWYGDMDLAPHLGLFAGGGAIDLHVVWCAPIPFDAGTDRKAATALAEAEVRRALRSAIAGRSPAGLPSGTTSGARATEDADVPASGVAAA